jgi:chromosomal replication initiator protein
MQAWESFLVEQEKELGKETASRWLKTLRVVDFDACNLYLEAQDSFQLSWFEEHLRQKIKTSLRNSNGHKIKVHVKTRGDAQTEKRGLKRAKDPQKEKVYRPTLNLSQDDLDPQSTLAEFQVASANEILFKFLCELTGFDPNSSTLQKPQIGLANPIFIHGASGVGKSHLLMGVANLLQKQNLTTFYIRAETFTQHVVAAIKNGAMQEFRKAYRHVDVLIIDDIHVFSNKGATQEEFFHTFNTLHGAGKQIILSANSPPQLLQAVEPRLVSRFEWGIMLRLERLNEEETKTWLNKRLELLDLPLLDESIDFLMKTFQGQVKPLQRALHAITLRSHLSNSSRKRAAEVAALDQKALESLISDLIEEEKKKGINPEKIIRATADYYGMRVDDLLGKSRAQECATPRQMAIYLCRLQLRLPFLKIGEIFSRDHSTIMTSVKQVEKKIHEQDKESCSAKLEILRRLAAET